MTRHDVANLVIRIFALWLGVSGIATIASAAWLAQVPDQPDRVFTVLLLAIPLPAGVALWHLAPKLAGAVFDRSGDTATFALTAVDVPPLAAFVVGLVTAAGAVPHAASWLAMQVMISRADGLMNPDVLPQLNVQSAGTGAEVVVRLVVGAVLIALSRRPGIWSTPGAATTDAAAAAD
jgi:uncharacterized membrane protein YtjA (UPF0391 family)